MIETHRNKNHIIKELKFGTGDLMAISVSSETRTGLGFYEIEEGKIGRIVKEILPKEKLFEEKLQVLITFGNIESLDVIIKKLQSIRGYFVDKEGSTEKKQ